MKRKRKKIFNKNNNNVLFLGCMYSHFSIKFIYHLNQFIIYNNLSSTFNIIYIPCSDAADAYNFILFKQVPRSLTLLRNTSINNITMRE